MATTQRGSTETRSSPEDLRVARPIFALREAAGHLGLPKPTIDEWGRTPVAFGLRIVIHGGAPGEDLVDRFHAGDTIGHIADDFEVPPDQVEDTIRVATRTAA